MIDVNIFSIKSSQICFYPSFRVLNVFSDLVKLESVWEPETEYGH